MPERASAAISSSPIRSRWSADAAESSAARRAPPERASSSACMRIPMPAALAAVRMRRDCATVKTPLSQNTSQNFASPAAAGTISETIVSTHSSGRSRSSGGNSCAASRVGTIRGRSSPFAAASSRSARSSSETVSPYPVFASTVVVPHERMRASRPVQQ